MSFIILKVSILVMVVDIVVLMFGVIIIGVLIGVGIVCNLWMSNVC